MKLKTVIFSELWNVRYYIGTFGDDATFSIIEMYCNTILGLL